MSTFKGLITISPSPRPELVQPLAQGARPSVKERDCQNAGLRQSPGGLMCRFGAFFRDCWRRIMVMRNESEQAESGNGARSRERGEERLRD